MNGYDEFSDRDLIAEPIGIIESRSGWAIPGRTLQLSQINQGRDKATLVAVTSWLTGGLSNRGIYTLLTPEGARFIASRLLHLADHADAQNATLTQSMMDRLSRKDRRP